MKFTSYGGSPHREIKKKANLSSTVVYAFGLVDYCDKKLPLEEDKTSGGSW